jgi:hypothetical protein
MFDSFSCSFTYTFLLQAVPQIKVMAQLVIRNDIDVNEHEKLSNITLRHKLK